MTSQARPASAASSLRNKAMTLSRSLKVGTTTDNSGVATAWVPCPGLMASFMRHAYIAGTRRCQGAAAKRPVGRPKRGQNSPKNANDHEQQARVHPAQPYHSVVVPAPE